MKGRREKWSDKRQKKKYGKSARRITWTALGICAVMGASAPVTAWAASPEFARSEEEWAKLRDNVLEYGEIPDLIHEYNVTVQNNLYDYNEFIKDYGQTREDIAKAYREEADDLESSVSGEEGVGMVSDFMMEQQARQLREQADDTLEDSQIYYWQYSQTEDSLAFSAQQKFLSYYKTQLELEEGRETLELRQNNYALLQTKQQAGTATASEVLDAAEAVQEQEKNVEELAQQVEQARQNLLVLCGWKGNDAVEISSVPELDLAQIDAIDLEADKQTALEQNYTLKINRRKLENAQDSSNKENIQKTIDSNEKQIAVSVTNSYNSLQTARRSYELALSQEAASERDMSLASQKWSAGMITKYEYQEAQASLDSSRLAAEEAYLALYEAWESYQWDVNGLAAAE